MAKRKSTTTIITLLLLLVFSLPALAVQGLTTTQMRENTIRINALEIKNMDITNIEAPKEMTIVLDERALNFDFDKSVVKPQYFEMLNNLKDFRSNQYNIGLSRRRAEAVKAKLIEFGLPEDRIVGIEAKGEEYPVATNETPEGRLQNRRVEFRLVQR